MTENRTRRMAAKALPANLAARASAGAAGVVSAVAIRNPRRPADPVPASAA